MLQIVLDINKIKVNGLFDITSINGLTLANRFVRSATWEGMSAAEGAVTPELINMYSSLAKGGIGLIISGHSYVSQEGQGSPRQLGIHKDELIDGLRELTTAVHQNGGKILMQLAHAGTLADEKLINGPPLAVSLPEAQDASPRKEVTLSGIKELVVAFASAAARAKSAGFDGVQIHAAHGYLLSQFLSSAYNRRNDKYGGSIRNRSRIHLEIYQAMRSVLGKNYPILIKINCHDFINNGMALEEALVIVESFSDAGFDAIELSGGVVRSGEMSPSRTGINSQEKEAYFRKYAMKIKGHIQCPLILVGGIRSFDVANRLINDRVSDYISMSRPFIREPYLVNRWRSGDLRKAKCKSDNLCYKPGFEGKGVYCVSKEIEEKSIVEPRGT